MGADLDEKRTCPRCGGLMGEATLERGMVISPCLSCDYVMAAPYCAPPPGIAPYWRIRIRWSGKEGPTLKEAALLRQFLPGIANHSIQEVRDLYRNTTDWSERHLLKDTMLQLREAAESRGFQVEAEEEGKRVTWPTLPTRRITSYGAEFNPSFHAKGVIFATFSELGDQVTIASDRGPATTETEIVDIPIERGVRFLDEIAALDPLGIPNALPMGLDGMTVEGSIREEGGVRKFHAWSPDPEKHPRQHGFLLALYRLASDLAREPVLIEFLENLHGYLQAGLPVKVFDGTPRRIRLFGTLSTLATEALDAFFASLPSDEPLLMDLSGFSSMGTLLHPRFASFHARPGRTEWWVNKAALRHLTEAGLPAACLHADLESALAALYAR